MGWDRWRSEDGGARRPDDGRATRKRAIWCGKDHAESGSPRRARHVVAEEISGSEKMRRIFISGQPIHSLCVFPSLLDLSG